MSSGMHVIERKTSGALKEHALHTGNLPFWSARPHTMISSVPIGQVKHPNRQEYYFGDDNSRTQHVDRSSGKERGFRLSMGW